MQITEEANRGMNVTFHSCQKETHYVKSYLETEQVLAWQ